MIGQRLREAREAKGCTLEDAERVTRIRAKFLAALEDEAFGALPSEAHARGFLRNYAQFLGLDADQAVAQFNDGAGTKLRFPLPRVASRARPSPPSKPAPQAEPQVPVRKRGLRLFSSDVLVAGVVTVGLALLLLWGGSQVLNDVNARATSGPSATAVTGLASPGTLASAPTATPTPAEAEATPTLPLPTPLESYAGVNVSVRAEQRIWLSVRTDGAEVFAGLMRPGEARDFVGQSVVELTTGNGRGTRVVWNGRDQGTLGEVGQVVTRLWTLDGMVFPTPTNTPSPSATPRP
jgi:cytoskeletal protein RodZ